MTDDHSRGAPSREPLTPDAVRAPRQTDAKDDRPNEPLDHGLPSVNEPDEADGAMEEPADVFRSRDEIEALRLSEGPGPEPHDPARG